MHSFLKHKMWFDVRFNSTGSEDSYFGIQMIKKGATIFWAANGIVFEYIPKKRATLNWLIRRKYRGAITYTYMLKLEKRHLSLLKKLSASFIYIFSGFIALLLLPIPIRRKYWGIIKLAEGLGGLAGFMNLKYNEYQ